MSGREKSLYTEKLTKIARELETTRKCESLSISERESMRAK